MAYYVNTNDHLVIYHKGITTNGVAASNMWSEIDYITIGSGDWTRVSIGMEYFKNDWAFFYFRLKINGSDFVTHENGKVNPPADNYDYSPGGSYFALADPGATQLNSIVMKGNGSFDDFVVTTNEPTFEIKYLIMSSVIAGANGGSLTPGDTEVDSGSNITFTVSVSNYWSIEKIVYVENGVTTTNTTADPIIFTAVSTTGSVSAYFIADTTNGVPLWWMADTVGTNADPEADADLDGLSNKEEWIASTDPDGDSNSVLRISRTWQQNGTNYVEWESAHVDTSLPAFGMMSCTDLVNGSFSNVGSIVRSGTTNVWSEAIPPVGTFYKVEATTNAP